MIKIGEGIILYLIMRLKNIIIRSGFTSSSTIGCYYLNYSPLTKMSWVLLQHDCLDRVIKFPKEINDNLNCIATQNTVS
jgi:hypothetical protein